MGNCQAAEGAAVVIQHPGGRVERLYWPTSAADVMKSNPGFYVALVTLYVSEEKPDGCGGGGGGTVRLTRVRLLKAKDMLLLGQVYRLIASQEVAKALRQRKYEKLKKCQAAEMMRKKQLREHEQQQQEKSEKAHQHQLAPTSRQERERQKSSTQMAARSRQWRPSLQSISENRKLSNVDHSEEEEEV